MLISGTGKFVIRDRINIYWRNKALKLKHQSTFGFTPVLITLSALSVFELKR